MSVPPVDEQKKRRGRALNAFCHGVYASDVVLPWESAVDFKALLECLIQEFFPAGPMECELVFDLARSRWLKRRLMRAAQIAEYRNPLAEELAHTERHGLKALRKVLRSRAKEEGGLRQRTAQMVRRCDEEMVKLCEALITLPDDDGKARKIEAKVTRLRKYKSAQILPLSNAIDQQDSLERCFENAYLPEILERIIKLEAIVDARLDKTLGRLVALKEFKRLAPTLLKPPTLSDGDVK